MRTWLKRGKMALRFFIFMAIPYLPLVSMAVPAGPTLAISSDGSPAGARVSSTWPVGDDLPDRLSSLFTQAAIRERARGWDVKRLESSGWRVLQSRRCTILGNVPIDDLRAAGVYADAFLEVLEDALERDFPDRHLAVRVFRDQEAFEVYASIAGAKGAASFYDPRSAEVVLRWPSQGHPWRLLMHELTHAHLDLAFKRREPLWIMEGLAEYFAGYDVGHGRFIMPGGASPEAEERIRRALEDGSYVPLDRLLAAGRDAFYGEAHDVYYAQAWSLVKFVAENQYEDWPNALAELARGGGLDDLGDLSDFEKRWLESIRYSH
ncbi:MAG: DUF1570 domain-containing protein [Planctomycetes bacterium]|nr:DUF1570 domain-containing protein [Planctomycetota bacterium]